MKPVYFVRHNWTEADVQPYIEKLQREKAIAIHYVNAGLDESYYKGSALGALRTLKKLEQEDCIVVAAYRTEPNHLHIGMAEKGSLGVEPFGPHRKQFKRVELRKVKTISFEDLALPFLIQPPYLALVHWEMGERAINIFYHRFKPQGRRKKPVEPELLSGWHLEVLCEEWLRRTGLLDKKLFKTGGSMKSADIVGVDKSGKACIAQVKHKGRDIDFREFSKLVDPISSRWANYFYFADRSFVRRIKDTAGVKLVAIEEVFDSFRKADPDYLRRLLYGDLR